MPSRDSLLPGEQRTLLRIARDSIAHGLRTGRPLCVEPSDCERGLRDPRAVFVTLRKQGALRGCIGELEPSRTLVESVAYHAYTAAFFDPRFSPVRIDELDALDIHVSVLSPLEEIVFETEDDLVAKLRPGEDGLLLQDGVHRATFLPAVWESLGEPWRFLRELKRKAGLPEQHGSPHLRAWRYEVDEFPAKA
jgi:hypothetical protein